MSRADELRAQADAIEAEEALAAEYDAALVAHRADVSDPALKAAYEQAKVALSEARRTARADRTGVRVVGDAFDTTPLSDEEVIARYHGNNGAGG